MTASDKSPSRKESRDEPMPEHPTSAEIERCKAAMSKPGPLSALQLIASGRAVVEVTDREVLIDTFDGRTVRDEDHPNCKMVLAGSWPLLRARMIDRYGLVTPAGHAVLAGAAHG